MEQFYFIIAMITAGISLSMGMLSISACFYKEKEKIDIIFGAMGVSLFIFFLIPPFGFILHDPAPYPLNIEIKRIFIALHYCLYPWFFELYTGFKKKGVSLSLNVLMVIGYIVMLQTPSDNARIGWVAIFLVFVLALIIYGVYLGLQQKQAGRKTKSRPFLFALSIYFTLFVLSAFNQLGTNYFGRLMGTDLFFPINLNPLCFMLIMAMRLRANSFEKFKLEKILRNRDSRWYTLLQSMHLIIIELDKKGDIKYINPYGVNALGYNDANELLNKNWYEQCLPVHEVSAVKSSVFYIAETGEQVPYFKNAVLTKEKKEIIVSWNNVFIYDDQGALKGSLSIGADITKEENAYRQIKQLKTELEKENFILKGEPVPDWMKQEIVGEGTAISYAIQKAKQVAATNATVLLEGETGVGKELFADLIHRISSRNTMPFIKVNCGALPAELIEDELFGHEKGAFTGAIQARKGRFELANGGTIFLDEIGELPISLQPKLLRVLQNGEFERVGGQQTIHVDVRIISATNKDLEKEAHEGRFREDLFYRLNVFPITIPPLRNRKEDIPLLVQFLVDKKARKHNKNIEHIVKADMNRLCDYAWPGNIRELKNVIERAIISSEGATLKFDWFYKSISDSSHHTHATESLEHMEKEHMLKILRDCNWRINGENGAAEKLDMHPNTLRSRMKKLNISRPAGKTV